MLLNKCLKQLFKVLSKCLLKKNLTQVHLLAPFSGTFNCILHLPHWWLIWWWFIFFSFLLSARSVLFSTTILLVEFNLANPFSCTRLSDNYAFTWDPQISSWGHMITSLSASDEVLSVFIFYKYKHYETIIVLTNPVPTGISKVAHSLTNFLFPSVTYPFHSLCCGWNCARMLFESPNSSAGVLLCWNNDNK